MKKLVVLLAVFVAFSVCAGSTNSPPTRSEPSIESQINVSRTATLLTLPQTNANEVIKGSLTYSGILVEAVKTRQPLQLFNPAAQQVVFGSPEDNVVRDPIHNKVTGLKLFAIRF